MPMQHSRQQSRRRFLRDTAVFGAGLTLLGKPVAAAAANGRLQLASIGVGGPVLGLPGQGSMFVGEKGYMLLPHVGAAQLLPKETFKDYKLPMQKGENHYHQWANACLGDGQATFDFGYAGPLTEVLLLGVIANRFPTQRLDFDAKALKITNFAAADKMIQNKYRSGWEVDGLS